MSVSYTHLDVYKIQVEMAPGTETTYNSLNMAVSYDSNDPVSYTHLEGADMEDAAEWKETHELSGNADAVF